jgi:hypothetical protein
MLALQQIQAQVMRDGCAICPKKEMVVQYAQEEKLVLYAGVDWKTIKDGYLFM